MGIKSRNKSNNRILEDPLGLDYNSQPDVESTPVKVKPVKKSRLRKSTNGILRNDEIRKMVDENGNVDTDAVISMYLPRRRARRLAATLRRLNKLYIILLILLLLLCGLFILSFTQEKMGNFTINLNRIEMYRKGISLSESGDFDEPTARLTADAISDATNISVNDLPADLDKGEGNHSGKNYLAYTYYVRNAGKEDLNYTATVDLVSSTKGAENAARVSIWKNGEKITYAAPAAGGGSEEGCVNFLSDDVVCVYTDDNFQVGDVDRYTVVVWLEGDDPECVDNIIGGSVQFAMSIDTDQIEEQSLLRMFIQDIKDMLSGNDPIGGSSDYDVPEYYLENEITWENRRNK